MTHFGKLRKNSGMIAMKSKHPREAQETKKREGSIKIRSTTSILISIPAGSLVRKKGRTGRKGSHPSTVKIRYLTLHSLRKKKPIQMIRIASTLQPFHSITCLNLH
jgi:hypothetical protein